MALSPVNTLVIISKNEKLIQHIENTAKILQIQDIKTFTSFPKNCCFKGTTLVIDEDLCENLKEKCFESICIIGKKKEKFNAPNVTYIEKPLRVDQLISFLIPLDEEDMLTQRRNSSFSILKSLSILVVEDSLSINKSIVKLLQNVDVTNIKSAFNGKEAIDMIENQNFDIILMDIQMPV